MTYARWLYVIHLHLTKNGYIVCNVLSRVRLSRLWWCYPKRQTGKWLSKEEAKIPGLGGQNFVGLRNERTWNISTLHLAPLENGYWIIGECQIMYTCWHLANTGAYWNEEKKRTARAVFLAHGKPRNIFVCPETAAVESLPPKSSSGCVVIGESSPGSYLRAMIDMGYFVSGVT